MSDAFYAKEVHFLCLVGNIGPRAQKENLVQTR